MLVDWIVFHRGKAPLSTFVATLGYSRASYVEFVTDERLATQIACHERAFDFFGGVPREVLYDNVKTVVIGRDVYGPGLHPYLPAFLDFCGHHGFVSRLCKPYRAKTKGKVERFNDYLRRSFYNPLVSRAAANPLSFTDFLEVWLKAELDAKHHRTKTMLLLPRQDRLADSQAQYHQPATADHR